MSKPLERKIAVVAGGAARGAGRCIATALGEARHGVLHGPQRRREQPY